MSSRPAFEPSRRLVMRIADPGLPFGGTWTYDLKDEEGGTSLICASGSAPERAAAAALGSGRRFAS